MIVLTENTVLSVSNFLDQRLQKIFQSNFSHLNHSITSSTSEKVYVHIYQCLSEAIYRFRIKICRTASVLGEDTMDIQLHIHVLVLGGDAMYRVTYIGFRWRYTELNQSYLGFFHFVWPALAPSFLIEHQTVNELSIFNGPTTNIK